MMKLLLLCMCVAVANAGLAPLITSNQRSLPDRWIIKIKDADQLDKVADEIEGKFTKMRIPIPRVTKIRKVMPALALRIPASLINDIRSLDGIEYLEQDSIETLAGSQWNPSWGLDRIDSRTGTDGYYDYNNNAQGNGANIYLLDSGIQTTHNVFGGRAYVLYGGSDDSGHGTHCAGTAAGDTYGIAREATIYSVKICTSGSCALSETLNGVDAVLLHAGTNGGVISRSLSGLSYDSPTLSEAMQSLWDNGLVVSHAAGNSNTDACTYTPQKMDEVIATGATDSSDTRAYFSNYGACVELFAPGVSIVSAKYSTSSDSGSSTKSGTSMSCPHTTGAAAVLIGLDTNATPQTIKDTLLSNATPDVVSDTNGSHNRLLYVSPS